MVAARIGMSVQLILISLVLGSGATRLWWLLFIGLAIVYGIAGWRYPRATFGQRRVLVLLAFIDLGLTCYEGRTFFNLDSPTDRFFWINLAILCLQLVPPLVITALVGKSVANMRQTASGSEVGSFALPDGTIVEFGSDDEY